MIVQTLLQKGQQKMKLIDKSSSLVKINANIKLKIPWLWNLKIISLFDKKLNYTFVWFVALKTKQMYNLIFWECQKY